MTKQKKQRTDINDIRDAASDNWPQIISSLASVSADVFDGRHQPCPKCGGKDRFRAFNDGSGGAICNQCFNDKNHDGIAVIQWLNGWDFTTTKNELASYLGIKPRSRTPKPDENIIWADWSTGLVQIWTDRKPPITPEAVQMIGGRFGHYRRLPVIALPHYGVESLIVGWTMYHLYGLQLPRYGKDGSVDHVKVKISAGSKPGLIGTVDRLGQNGECWKCEGPTDVLSLLSVNPDLCVVTNSNGAGQKPGKMAERFTGHSVVNIIHDCDKPGQDGVANWSAAIDKYAGQVRNVILPYPIEQNHGKDLRDFLQENDFVDLSALALQAVAFNPKTVQTQESVDDPYRLARANIERYKSVAGGTLKFWRDRWFRWKGTHYIETEPSTIKIHMTTTVRKEYETDYQDRIGTDDEGPIKKVTTRTVNEAINAMKTITFVPWSTELETLLSGREKKRLISLKNGLIDVDRLISDPDNFELQPHTSDWFTVLHRPYDFNPDAECPIWLKFLETSMEGDLERMALLQEWCGYCLVMDTSRQAFLIMEGEGGNGKSAFFAGVTAMLGEDSVSHTPLEKFGERFDLYGTVGKLLNISADTGEIDKRLEGIIKAFVGDGNKMEFDRKGISKVTASVTAKLAIGVNNRPRWHDKTEGMWRRMILVPWNRKVRDEERIWGMDHPGFWVRNCQVEGMFLWALQGLLRLTKNDAFTMPMVCAEAIAEYQREANPAREFLADSYMECGSGSFLTSKEIYTEYKQWCQENGYRPLGNRLFGKEVKRVFGKTERIRKRLDGNREWIYSGMTRKNEDF